MYLYKCDKPECGKTFKSQNPESCPKCNSEEFSISNKKSNSSSIKYGLLILLIGAGIFYIKNDINTDTASTIEQNIEVQDEIKTLNTEKNKTTSFDGGVMYTTTDLNVRKNPNQNSEKLHWLKTNTSVLTNSERMNGWVLIADIKGNQLGYIKSKYLSEKITNTTLSKNKITKKTSLTAEDYFLKAYNSNDQKYKIENFKKCLNIDSKYIPEIVYCNIGHAYRNIKNYDEAIKNYSKSIKIDPELATSYFYRGFTYYKIKRYEDAVGDFNIAIIYDYEKADDIYYYRGWCYQRLFQHQYAIDNFTKAININPNDLDSYLSRATAHLSLNNYFDVINDCSKVIRKNPAEAMAYGLRATAKKRSGKYYCRDYSKGCKLGDQMSCDAYNENCN